MVLVISFSLIGAPQVVWPELVDILDISGRPWRRVVRRGIVPLNTVIAHQRCRFPLREPAILVNLVRGPDTNPLGPGE
jgi:hypothetical protein